MWVLLAWVFRKCISEAQFLPVKALSLYITVDIRAYLLYNYYISLLGSFLNDALWIVRVPIAHLQLA